MGHIYLSHSHPIAIYACPISWDVSHGIPIGMTFPWTSLVKALRGSLALTLSIKNFRVYPISLLSNLCSPVATGAF